MHMQMILKCNDLYEKMLTMMTHANGCLFLFLDVYAYDDEMIYMKCI